MAILITFFDEMNVWKVISPEIERRNPLSQLELSVRNQLILLETLNVHYLPHTEVNWNTAPADAYKKPCLWLFILVCPTYSQFTKDIKRRLKVWVSNMASEAIEWLVLYIPSLSDFSPNESVVFAKTFDKISRSIGDRYKFTRLYSPTSKQFLNLNSTSLNENEYWEEFMGSLSRSLSTGISRRITLYIEMLLSIDYNSDFYSYCMAQEGLGIVYEYCGMPLIANECYAAMKNAELGQFVPVSMQDIQRGTSLTTEEFRIAMLTGSVSELSFRDYVYHRQKYYLEMTGDVPASAELALQFISSCLRLFAVFPDETIGYRWVVNTASRLGAYFATNAHNERVHYASSLLLRIAKSRLEREGPSAMLYDSFKQGEVTQEMSELCKKIREESEYTPNKRGVECSSFDFAISSIMLGRSTESIEILEDLQFMNWPSLHTCVQGFLFHCYKHAENKELAIEVALHLVGRYPQLWDVIDTDNIVRGDSAFAVTFDISKRWVEITNKTDATFVALTITTRYFKLINIDLQPGRNKLDIIEIDKSNSINGLIIELKSLKIEVTVPNEVLSLRTLALVTLHIPELLVVDQVQELVIQLTSYNESLTDCVLTLNGELRIEEKAQLIINEEKETVYFTNNTLTVPDLQPATEVYVVIGVTAQSLVYPRDSYKSHEVYSKISSVIDYSFGISFTCYSSQGIIIDKCEKRLNFGQPLSIKSNIIEHNSRTLIQAVILNCSPFLLRFQSINAEGCHTIEECKCESSPIAPGEHLYAGFIVNKMERPMLVVKFTPTDAKGIPYAHSIFTCEHSIGLQEVVQLQHGERGVVGEEFSVRLSFVNPVTAIVQVNTSAAWRVPDLFQGVVGEDIELKLVPMQKGPCELPDILVWVGDKRVPVRGSRKVVCYTNDC